MTTTVVSEDTIALITLQEIENSHRNSGITDDPIFSNPSNQIHEY